MFVISATLSRSSCFPKVLPGRTMPLPEPSLSHTFDDITRLPVEELDNGRVTASRTTSAGTRTATGRYSFGGEEAGTTMGPTVASATRSRLLWMVRKDGKMYVSSVFIAPKLYPFNAR